MKNFSSYTKFDSEEIAGRCIKVIGLKESTTNQTDIDFRSLKQKQQYFPSLKFPSQYD